MFHYLDNKDILEATNGLEFLLYIEGSLKNIIKTISSGIFSSKAMKKGFLCIINTDNEERELSASLFIIVYPEHIAPQQSLVPLLLRH